MSERTWHKGPPPHVGWWCCTNNTDRSGNEGLFLDCWRWWDGYRWSIAAYYYMSAEAAAIRACESYSSRLELVWTDYWPDFARVPRIDPRRKA